MNEHKQSFHARFIYLFAGFLAASLLIVGLRAPKTATIHGDTNFQNINDNWTLEENGASTHLQEVCHYSYQAQTVKIQRRLPAQITAEFLLFYTEHQELTVTIDDVLIYDYAIPEEFSYLKTPGSTWHTIPLDSSDAGKMIEMTFHCSFSEYRMLPSDIFFLHEGELQIAQAYSLWFCNTAAIFMMVLAIISYVNGSFWKSSLLKSYTLHLGTVYLFIALWLFSEINITTIVVRNDIATYLCSMLFIRLLPLSFYYFIQATSCTRSKHNWIEWVFVANLFLPFLLQFTLHIPLLNTIKCTYLLALVSASVVLLRIAVRVIKQFMGHLIPTFYDMLHFCSALLLCGIFGELYLHTNYAKLGLLRGTFISIAAILYTIVSRIIVVRIETNFEQTTKELELENSKLQLLPLTQQINAHFLFNTLNTISALCKSNPKLADHAVLLLARYMREYMLLVNASDLILFSHEQVLMETYLKMQQIRFPETISFSVTNDTADFYLPPLCIQPFVENAILHGIRRKKEGGEINITSRQEGELIKITVHDNGVGFDTATLQKSTRVGIQNVQKRMALYGGWVALSSGAKGTTVDIFIPAKAQPLDTGLAQ